MAKESIQQHNIFQTYLRKSKEEFTEKFKKEIIPRTQYDDYDFIQILGYGSYGQVVAAQHVASKNIFAVKVINKSKLAKEDHMKHLLSEIRILNSISFEFLISLECYFTNKCYVFVILPYVGGGSFFKLLRKLKKFEEDAARFFAGQVVLAIEYLHYMGIVYRDLKPENLLLDMNGYLKLVDFGFAKRIDQSYCYTFCGTSEYMAPEIILSKGYSFSPDWWALGILLFEMCNGAPPFTSKNELKLFEKILVGVIKWPEHFSFELKSIIEGLLQVDKSKRLGCMKNKVEDIKFHKWFASLNWTALWNKHILPPVKYSVPKLPEEKEYFDKVKFSFIDCDRQMYSQAAESIDVAI